MASPDFSDVGFRCFSQNSEDGVLLYLFSLLGTTNRRVVELCAGNGVECNAANLIVNHGWSGLLFDGNEANLGAGRAYYARCQDTFVVPPTLAACWITVENVNALIRGNGFDGDIDLLSLDMDGVDYWIWKALDCVRPRVVVLEFNAAFGPERAVTVPYRPDFQLDLTKQPYYCGASLPAFVKLAREKGLRLVGAERGGFNAFFVREGIGEDVFPTISVSQLYERHPVLRQWTPGWIPDSSQRPEFAQVVEV